MGGEGDGRSAGDIAFLIVFATMLCHEVSLIRPSGCSSRLWDDGLGRAEVLPLGEIILVGGGAGEGLLRDVHGVGRDRGFTLCKTMVSKIRLILTNPFSLIDLVIHTDGSRSVGGSLNLTRSATAMIHEIGFTHTLPLKFISTSEYNTWGCMSAFDGEVVTGVGGAIGGGEIVAVASLVVNGGGTEESDKNSQENNNDITSNE